MIDIMRNKIKYVNMIDRKNLILENRFAKDLYPTFKNLYSQVSNSVEHGNINIINYVNSILNDVKNKLIKQYKKVGEVYFGETQARMADAIGKKNYEMKDTNGIFWGYFDGWAKMYALNKAVMITETTKNILTMIIKNAIEEGLSYIQIAKKITETGIISNKFRAKVIASTETHTAFSQSVYKTIDSSSIRPGYKEWVNVGDERVRLSHQTAPSENGRISRDQPFKVGGESLMFPGDPTGSAEEVILCRCQALYYSNKE